MTGAPLGGVCGQEVMKGESRQSGMTLTELIVVVGGIVLLAVLGLPAVRALVHSFESGSGTRAMIGSALASARALAAKEQRYVGVRFQKAYDADNPDPNRWPQYMIFVINDYERTGHVNGFRALEGIRPIELPDSIGVMDTFAIEAGLVDPLSEADIIDLTTFTVTFSPAGKVVLHEARCDSTTTAPGGDVFNTRANIAAGIGMFVEDGDEPAQPVDEMSRTHFVIYDRLKFVQAHRRREAVAYLASLPAIYVNAYMGTLISTE